MRRCVVVFAMCLVALGACGSPPSTVPARQSGQVAAYPSPAVLAPATESPRPLAQPTASATPPPAPLSVTAPPVAEPVTRSLKITSSARYVLAEPGTYVAAWSADGTNILYAQGGGIGEKLIVFDHTTKQSTVIATDGIDTQFHQQLRPRWDYEHDRIIYARVNTLGKANNGASVRVKPTADIVSIKPDGSQLTVITQNISLYDAALNTKGNSMVFINNQLTWIKSNKSANVDIKSETQDSLAKDSDRFYHRLWLAPDDVHYAIVISHSLEIYRTGQIDPIATYTFKSPGVVHRLEWSPDSNLVYYHVWDPRPPFDDYGTYMHKINENTPKRLEFISTSGISWDPNNNWFAIEILPEPQCAATATGCVSGQIIVDLHNLRNRIDLVGFLGAYEQALWSPDGKMIAGICYSTQGKQEIGELCIAGLEE